VFGGKKASVSPTLSPTKTPDSQTGKDNPSTGDQTSSGKWIFGVIASGIGIAAAYRKKKEDKQES
jgi:LPXTG-motif cell wall-anchored protein